MRFLLCLGLVVVVALPAGGQCPTCPPAYSSRGLSIDITRRREFHPQQFGSPVVPSFYGAPPTVSVVQSSGCYGSRGAAPAFYGFPPNGGYPYGNGNGYHPPGQFSAYPPSCYGFR